MISPGLHQHAHADDLIKARPGRQGLLPPAPPAPAFLRVIGDAVDRAIVCIGAVMIVLVFINVVLHLFGKDMAATTEICELLMVWVTFLGGAAATRRGAHMAITELIDKLNVGSRRMVDLGDRVGFRRRPGPTGLVWLAAGRGRVDQPPHGTRHPHVVPIPVAARGFPGHVAFHALGWLADRARQIA